MDKKIISITLIVVGFVFLLYFLDSMLSAEPENLLAWVSLALSAGANLKGWRDLLKKEQPAAPGEKTIAMDNAQIAKDNARIVNQGAGSEYYEGGQHTHIHTEKEPTPDPKRGAGNPSPKTDADYVLRGIEDEVLADLESRRRVVIVSGLGGVGKSEMASHLMRRQELKDKFLWVTASEKNATEILQELARKYEIKFQGEFNPPRVLSDLTQKAQTQDLVVLDDVREAARDDSLLTEILALPCRFLLTSRLDAFGGIKKFDLSEMTPAQARDLIARILGEELARREEETARKVAERLSYNPLGVEIAARWVALRKEMAHPFEAFYQHIKDNLKNTKAPGDKKWNLFAAFDVSYNDLTEEERRRFRALAVFAPSGFSPAAAAALWSGDPADSLDHLLSLRLLMTAPAEAERYRLHDLLREYALDKLNRAGEQEQAQTALANWLIELFDKHYADDISSAPEVGLEFDNLAKTAEWALQNSKRTLLASLATKPRNWLLTYYRDMES